MAFYQGSSNLQRRVAYEPANRLASTRSTLRHHSRHSMLTRRPLFFIFSILPYSINDHTAGKKNQRFVPGVAPFPTPILVYLRTFWSAQNINKKIRTIRCQPFLHTFFLLRRELVGHSPLKASSLFPSLLFSSSQQTLILERCHFIPQSLLPPRLLFTRFS